MTRALPRNRILLMTGPGKGKTTAALGTALRAWGHGMRVLVVQFVKGNRRTGEWAALERLPGVAIDVVGKGFLPRNDSDAFAEHVEAARAGLQRVRERIENEEFHLVVLDEVAYAAASGLLTADDIRNVIEASPQGTVFVLTGRNAPEALVRLADTVSEIADRKHAYRNGVGPQAGVEY
ncbi:cob(I)yrinic acid a,c-diamide adenosyltransferase [Thermostilla marina]